MSKFYGERSDVEHLLALLGISQPNLVDPNNGGRDETGADVAYICPARRIGIQVTEYSADEGNIIAPKQQSRATERKLATKAAGSNEAIKGYGMTSSGNYIQALKVRIKAKLMKSMAPFDEKWLLILAQKISWGSTMSTFAAAAHIAIAEMNLEIDPLLRGSQYDRVLLVLQLEKVVVEWTPTRAR